MKTKKQAAEITRLLERAYPIAECTLDTSNAWQLLVSVRLAAQCTDARVNMITPILFEKYPSRLFYSHKMHDSFLFFIIEGGLFEGTTSIIVFVISLC